MLLVGATDLHSSETTTLIVKAPQGEKRIQVPILWEQEKNAVELDTMPTLRTLIKKNRANANATYVWANRTEDGTLNLLMLVAGDLANVEATKYLLENGAHPTACVYVPRTCGSNRDRDPIMKGDSIKSGVKLDNALALVVGKTGGIRRIVESVNSVPRNHRKNEVNWLDLEKAFDLKKDSFPITHDEIDEALQNHKTKYGYFPDAEELHRYASFLPLGVVRIIHEYQAPSGQSEEWLPKQYDYIKLGKRYIEIFAMLKAKQRELETAA